MSIKDIIKSSVLGDFVNNSLSMREVALLMLIATILGVYIFFVYRFITGTSFYSKTFNISLMVMCIITTAIIITIQSSVVISLGMVGALSIVRFRTAIKEPMDLVFAFWSISIGIITGAGLPGLAIVLVALVTVTVVLFMYMPEQKKSLILNINGKGNLDCAMVLGAIEKYDKHYQVKSRNITGDCVAILLEVHLKDCEMVLKELRDIEGVMGISLISHKGEMNY